MASRQIPSGAALMRLLRTWLTPRRPVDPVDDLIAANRARFRPGMSRPDWTAVDRAGQRQWHRTLRAQRRLVKPQGERVQRIGLWLVMLLLAGGALGCTAESFSGVYQPLSSVGYADVVAVDLCARSGHSYMSTAQASHDGEVRHLLVCHSLAKGIGPVVYELRRVR